MTARVVRAWRACLLVEDQLVSPHRGTVWPGPVLRAETWSTSAAVRGEAGIHAAHRVAGSDLPRPLTAYALVRVAVCPGADCVVGTEGIRAQAVVVRSVVLPWWATDEQTSAVAERYQCPVRRRRPGAPPA